MISTYWMFEDKSQDVEFTVHGDAVEYRPWGIVTCIQLPIDRADGNVIAVLYRSPGGRLFRRWRQIHEVELKEVTESEWKSIQDLLLMIEDEAVKDQKSNIVAQGQKPSSTVH